MPFEIGSCSTVALRLFEGERELGECVLREQRIGHVVHERRIAPARLVRGREQPGGARERSHVGEEVATVGGSHDAAAFQKRCETGKYRG
jgi:hypothetical protein